MLPIPPLAYSVTGTAAQAARQIEEKSEQVRRAQVKAKDSAANGDEYVHTVESTDELQPIHDQDARQQQGKPKHPRKPFKEGESDEPLHLDLKA